MKQIVTITGENLKVVANNVEVNAACAGKRPRRRCVSKLLRQQALT